MIDLELEGRVGDAIGKEARIVRDINTTQPGAGKDPGNQV